MNRNWIAAILGLVGLAGALVYVFDPFDPDRGRRRREKIGDQASHLWEGARNSVEAGREKLGDGPAPQWALGALGAALALYGGTRGDGIGKALSTLGAGLLTREVAALSAASEGEQKNGG